MSGDGDAGPRGALFGAFIIVVGMVTLLTVGSIRATAFGGNNDPGPRALPRILAVCLIAGGAATVAATLISRHRHKRQSGDQVQTAPTERSNRLDAAILLGALLLYIVAISWIGFTVSTLLFSVGMMWRLKTGWVLNLSVSIGLVAVIHVLFVMLFRVQLPAGELGLPF